MFTGLIEDLGKVARLEPRRAGLRLTVLSRLSPRGLAVGSSVAVNGACLTVAEKAKGSFSADVSPETLERTNLGDLKPGDYVNLERPLRLSDRVGGHLVTGHVDTTAVTRRVRAENGFVRFEFELAAPLERLLVPKGSVAVDGISLTVNECDKRRFSVLIIPFTLKHTNLQQRKVGDRVNVETDLIGKYVLKALAETLRGKVGQVFRT